MSRVSFGKTNFDGGRYIRIDDATTTYDGDVKSSFKIKRDDVIRVVWSQKYSRRNCHSSYYFLRRSATMILFIGVIDFGMDAKST